MDGVLDFIREWGPEVVVAIVILIVARILIRVLVRVLGSALDKRQVEPAATRFLGSVVTAILWVAVFITVLQVFGVPTTSFIAIVGALGLAIGLALQDQISNFAAGVMILVFKPFVAGEFVEAAGVSGTVLSVEVVATTLLTPDNKRVTVPNSQVMAAPVTNYSREDRRRVDLVFGIGYDDDLRLAKELLEGMAADDERVLDDPEPAFPVLALGASSVDIGARLWVTTDDYWPVFFDWTERVKLAFDANGISIPYPQTDVHLVPVETDEPPILPPGAGTDDADVDEADDGDGIDGLTADGG